MKLNKETLKQIIKEELERVLIMENDLMSSDIYGNPGYETYLISPRYISQNMDSSKHFRFGEPDYLADLVKQGLRGEGNYSDALDAAFKLYELITADEADRHPAFPQSEKSRNEIMDFLDSAIQRLQ